MILAATRLAAISLAAFTPLLAEAFVVRSPSCTMAGALVQQTRFGRASPPFVLSDMIESSEDTPPELLVENEADAVIESPEDSQREEEETIESSSEDSAPEMAVEEEEAEEEEASSSEEHKRIVTRERHTAFVGNLPFGRFLTVC